MYKIIDKITVKRYKDMTGKLYIMDKKNENKSLKKKIHNKKIIKDIKNFFSFLDL